MKPPAGASSTAQSGESQPKGAVLYSVTFWSRDAILVAAPSLVEVLVAALRREVPSGVWLPALRMNVRRMPRTIGCLPCTTASTYRAPHTGCFHLDLVCGLCCVYTYIYSRATTRALRYLAKWLASLLPS